MNKWLTLTIAICSLLVLVGCAPQPDLPEASTPSPTPTPEETPSPPTEEEPALTPEPTPESLPSSIPTIEPARVIGKISQSSELITCNYVWEYNGQWNWEGQIPQSLYEYYQEIPRPPTENYSVYVTHPLDDIYIERLVEKIQKAAQQEGFTEYETVEFAAAFVQSLPYTADSVTTPYDEYPRYPIETLVDNGGDCEDTSILLASLIDKMGYGVVLIMLPNHCAVGVKGGENVYGTYWQYKEGKYYYLETTGRGWRIGQLPEEYENTAASIRPMIPTPILTHDWSLKGRGNIGELGVTVYNLGSATAYNVSVLAGFDAGGDMLWNGELSDPFQVGISQQVTVKLNIRVPLDKHTRLTVQIGIDGCLVDESHSKWVDT